jgi:hypothetical protein
MDINIEELRDYLEGEADIREKLKDENNEFEKITRALTGALNKIHSTLPADGTHIGLLFSNPEDL